MTSWYSPCATYHHFFHFHGNYESVCSMNRSYLTSLQAAYSEHFLLLLLNVLRDNNKKAMLRNWCSNRAWQIDPENSRTVTLACKNGVTHEEEVPLLLCWWLPTLIFMRFFLPEGHGYGTHLRIWPCLFSGGFSIWSLWKHSSIGCDVSAQGKSTCLRSHPV